MVLKVYRFILTVFILLFFSASIFAKTPKVLKLSELKPGTKAIGFSVFKGIEPQPFDVELGEVNQRLQLYLILARISGGPMETPLENTGAIAGMSGSPVFINCSDLDDCIENGTLVGAVSYRIGEFIEGGMNSMITPAEYMLGAGTRGYAEAYQLGHMPSKISFKEKEYDDLALYPDMDKITENLGTSSKCPDYSGHKLKPGSMISIYLAWGEVPIPVSGTVTWVDEDNSSIYVFGHQIFGAGIIRLPFAHVSVSATLQTPFQPHKIPGCYLETEGVMVVDGVYESAGIIGGKASLLPYNVNINLNGQTISLHEEVAESPYARSILTVLPVILAQSVFGDINNLPVSYQIRIAIKDEPEIFIKNIISAEAPGFMSPINGLFGVLDDTVFTKLKSYGLSDGMEKVSVDVNFTGRIMTWKNKTSFLSQKSASPGDTVYINIILEEISSRNVRQMSIPVKIPDDFMDRIEPGELSVVKVFVQSGSRFTNKKDAGFQTLTPGDNIKELNTVMNLKANTLYVQQILPKTKSDKENSLNLAKSATKAPWKWNDLQPGELNLLPVKDDSEVISSATSPLDHFIDFDASFNIAVNQKETAKAGAVQEKKKSRKWFLLFLF